MTITKRVVMLLITLVGLAGLLNAQRAATTVKAQVPFAFVANGKTMPAGECTIAVLGNGRTLLSINSGDQHTFAFPISVVSANARKKTTLVFRQSGERYFPGATPYQGGTG